MGRVAVDPRTMPDDTPFRLDVIAAAAFPDGGVSARSLIRESGRGNLDVWRVAGKPMTTMAAIRRMLDKCLVNAAPPASGSDQPKTAEGPSGASSTGDGAKAQAALLAKLNAPKPSSKPTSPRKGTRPSSPNVVPMRPS